MARSGDDLQFRSRPRLVQRPGGGRRRDEIIAPLDDDAGETGEELGAGEQLPLFEKRVVDEIMRLDTGERELRLARARPHRIGLRHESEQARFPRAPISGGVAAESGIGAGQAPVIGADEIVALACRNWRGETREGLRKQPRRAALLVEPVELAAPGGEDAAQNESIYARAISLCIGERQRRPP